MRAWSTSSLDPARALPSIQALNPPGTRDMWSDLGLAPITDVPVPVDMSGQHLVNLNGGLAGAGNANVGGLALKLCRFQFARPGNVHVLALHLTTDRNNPGAR